MALQIVTGDLSVNKKRVIIERLLKILSENPEATIYYVVPDHLKFEMETFVLSTIAELTGRNEAAMMNLQVVSFTRLAWFMIRPQSPNRQSISDVGLTMMIRQLLSGLKNELIVFRGQVNHQGFVEKLLTLFDELIEGNISPEDLSSITSTVKFNGIAESLELPNLEQQKINELQLIYVKFIDRIESFDLSQYNTLKQLESFIAQTGNFNNHYVVIDHYYYFNAQQMSLLMQLGKSFNSVWLTLPITHRLANSSVYQPILDSVRYTYHQVKQISQYNHIKVLPDWDINQPGFDIHPDLLMTAKLFKDIQEVGLTVSEDKVNYLSPPIEIWQSDTIQTELRHVSNQIHHLVANEGYRYQDITVMTRDIERYQAIVEPYFEANDIPIFIDNVAKMNHHPFVLLIESILNLKLYNWKYDDVMGLLKSDLILPIILEEETIEKQRRSKRQQVNYFENIILANGYFGYRLTSDNFIWHFDEEDKKFQHIDGYKTEITLKELANLWREWLNNYVNDAFKVWNKPMTGQEASAWLYQLIIDLGITEQFIAGRDQAIDMGDIEGSRRDEQVWQAFVDLLDEFTTIYKDDVVTYDLFVELLLVGLTESSYHIIPATLDQVSMTSIESPQVQPFKVAFIIGADERSLPLTRQVYSLLDESSRQILKDNLLPHQYLMNINDQQYSQELLLAYQMFLQASERLYLSYSANINNLTVRISPYIEQIADLLKLPTYVFTHDLVEELNHMHTSSFGKYAMEQNLVLQIAHHLNKETGRVTEEYKQVFLAMKEQESKAPVYQLTLRSLVEAVMNFNQLPVNISPKIALKLFGKDMNASVSKIEQYYQDPFSHYLIHGLRIKERKLFELDYARSGDYFHDFLDRFTQMLIQEQVNLRGLDEGELRRIYSQVKSGIEQDERFNIMFSHAKFTAIKTQMDQQLLNFIRFTQTQQQRTRMTSVQSEAIFGVTPSPQHLQGFAYPLNSGGKLGISGKIDRVDVAKIQNQDYLQIVDYKSGQKQFDLVDVYYGLDLQVLTYLSVALSNYPETKPFGAFYQPLLHSYLTYKEGTTPESRQVVDELQLANNTFNGFVSVNEEQLVDIDSSIEMTNNSLVYPVKFKKDGSYNAYSHVFTESDLDILLKYVHYKFKQAANQIQSGIIVLQPFKENQFTTSLQPEYRVISGFDSTENYQAYREKTVTRKNVIQQMKLELEESEEDEDEV